MTFCRLLEAKRKEIEKIENAKQAEKEKDQLPGDPTLVQKIVQQVIKNAQVYIRNIHIRFVIIKMKGKLLNAKKTTTTFLDMKTKLPVLVNLLP